MINRGRIKVADGTEVTMTNGMHHVQECIRTLGRPFATVAEAKAFDKLGSDAARKAFIKDRLPELPPVSAQSAELEVSAAT